MVGPPLFFGAFFLWPILQILRGGFVDPNGNFAFAYVIEIFTDPIQLQCLGNSFQIAVATTVLTLPIATPLAFVSNRFLFPGKQAWSALVLAPMILPSFVGAIGIRQIFGQYTACNAGDSISRGDHCRAFPAAGPVTRRHLPRLNRPPS